MQPFNKSVTIIIAKNEMVSNYDIEIKIVSLKMIEEIIKRKIGKAT